MQYIPSIILKQKFHKKYLQTATEAGGLPKEAGQKGFTVLHYIMSVGAL